MKIRYIWTYLPCVWVLGMSVHAPQHTYGIQERMHEAWFSSPILYVPGVDLRLSELANVIRRLIKFLFTSQTAKVFSSSESSSLFLLWGAIRLLHCVLPQRKSTHHTMLPTHLRSCCTGPAWDLAPPDPWNILLTMLQLCTLNSEATGGIWTAQRSPQQSASWPLLLPWGQWENPGLKGSVLRSSHRITFLNGMCDIPSP